MDFTLSDDQQLLRDTARGLLEKECPPSLVRAYQDDPTAADGLWKHLSDWLELGQGPLVDLCLFLEELGAVVAPGPFFSQTVPWAPLGLEGTGTVWFADDPTMPYVLDALSVDNVAVVDGESVTVVDSSSLDHRPVETIDWTRNLSKIEKTAAKLGRTARPSHLGEVSGLQERAWVALSAEL